jgi:uncharacterized membrane protein HdeD (DUF308 family)
MKANERMQKRSLPTGKFLMILGISLVILGMVSISLPVVAGKALVYSIGGLLLFVGIFQLVTGLREISLSGKLLGVLLGAITGITGLAVLAHPLYGLAALTLVLAMFFVIEGIGKIIVSFSYRPAPGWIGVLLSGVLGLVLGLMIWNQWPLSGTWAIGVLVGVDLVSTGVSLIALSMTIKQAVGVIQERVGEVSERIEAASHRRTGGDL